MILHPANKEFFVADVVDFVPPKNRHHSFDVAWSLGSSAISDTTTDLNTHEWLCYSDNGTVYVKRKDGQPIELFTVDGEISQLDFCFDQNARPVVVYVIGNESFIYQYFTSDFEHRKLPDTVKCPRIALDHVKLVEMPISDIVLGYCYDGKLCYRLQRDRYGVEYIIGRDSNKHLLWRIGITTEQRFGFQWR